MRTFMNQAQHDRVAEQLRKVSKSLDEIERKLVDRSAETTEGCLVAVRAEVDYTLSLFADILK